MQLFKKTHLQHVQILLMVYYLYVLKMLRWYFIFLNIIHVCTCTPHTFIIHVVCHVVQVCILTWFSWTISRVFSQFYDGLFLAVTILAGGIFHGGLVGLHWHNRGVVLVLSPVVHTSKVFCLMKGSLGGHVPFNFWGRNQFSFASTKKVNHIPH